MRRWLSGGRSSRLAVLFLAVVVPPAVMLVWLGLELVEQDRLLWAQRGLEERQATAQLVIQSLKRALADSERLTGPALPDGMVRFELSEKGLRADPADRLLWLPVAPVLAEAETGPFSQAEALEFRGETGRALRIYQAHADAPSATVQAGALLRIARVHRRAQRWDDTLDAYRGLAEIEGVGVLGLPADLVARRAMGAVLEASGRKAELDRESAALQTDLLGGRWALDKPSWELTARQLEQWLGRPLPRHSEAKAFSTVAGSLWEEWRRRGGEPFPMLGRSSAHEGVTLLWRSEGDVLAISQLALEQWVVETDTGGQLSLLAETGQVLVGTDPGSGPGVVTRSATETRLPWTVVVSPGATAGPSAQLVNRRQVLSLGLVAIVLLLGGGSYVLWRAVRRELAVARVQTEFVSAVSHEFRTPLASLRHVTELMQEDDDLPLERRRSFYAALGRNTERLQRLVESLLDFARMEGGRKPYEFELLDAGELAKQVVTDFEEEVEPRGFRVELEVDASGPLTVQADVASLTNALWNVLDNAVKYSTDERVVRVSVKRDPGGVAIAVHDDGLGVPGQEQEEIFRRFVRGKEAIRLGVKGTGLGLAMVAHIVNAHGGTVELESEEGVGSTFRLVLPTEA